MTERQLTINLAFLEERGACEDSRTAFEYEVVERFGRKDFDVLLSYVAKRVREIGEENWEAWLLAQPEYCKFMLDTGTSPDLNDYFALEEASREGYTESIKLLVEAGADIDESVALECAVSKDQHKAIIFLLSLGAYPSHTLFFEHLSENSRVSVIDKFIESGVEINAHDLLGAYRRCNFGVIGLLVNAYENKQEALELAKKADKEVQIYLETLFEDSDPNRYNETP